jgi:hypothetical protein
MLFTILLFGMATILLAACIGTAEQPTIEMLFSPTPTLTLTPTIQWFPVTATPILVVVPTSTPNPLAHPSHGALIFSDEGKTKDAWVGLQDSYGTISVNGNSVTLSVNAVKGSLTSLRAKTTLDNFYFESVMSVGLCKKDDLMGVLFRASDAQNHYRFLFNCQGMISLQQVADGRSTNLTDWSLSNQVQTSLNSPVKIGVWASGRTLRIYLNDQLQFETTNGTFRSGGIGFYAKSSGDTTVTASFSSINVYEAE